MCPSGAGDPVCNVCSGTSLQDCNDHAVPTACPYPLVGGTIETRHNNILNICIFPNDMSINFILDYCIIPYNKCACYFLSKRVWANTLYIVNIHVQ